MKLKSGIASKILIWYFIFMLIFYGTIVILYINVQQMMKISENIVNKNYKIASASKKMIENLLYMEETEKKYLLLRREDYLDYFTSARKAFEGNLKSILELTSKGMTVSPKWQKFSRTYGKFSSLLSDPLSTAFTETLWIPENVLNQWIQEISHARTDNEKDVELANRELNRRGQFAVQSGLVGLGISVLVGLLGSMFFANSMIRPLRELFKGIRSVSDKRSIEPIAIRTKDEFGELAGAFNEMAIRLKKEERMRSDFIAMLSHEIRTPLTSILESVNLIGEGVTGPINDRQKKFLEIASLEIARVRDLLNHLMQVSRLQSDSLKIRSRAIDPSPFISRCIDNLSPAAEARGIAIQMQIPRAVPKVMGDAEHLQQVLLNLLGNAIKFSPAGSQVTVSVKTNAGREKLIFAVSDNGKGIPEEEQMFIFDKYYRARGVRDHMDGVGLGLSISKHIVEAHGGTIWVASKVGQGSTFAFALPLAGERPKSRSISMR